MNNLCVCGEIRYKTSAYCYDCYREYSNNQQLRKRTKQNEPKFDNLSKYIKEIENNGGLGLEDINGLIEMYNSFYGQSFNYLDRSVSHMWKSIKKLNEKCIK